MSADDPTARDFGRLEERVDALDSKLTGLSDQITELVKLAERAKGGFWLGLGIASAVGSAVSVIGKAFGKAP